MKPRQIVVDLLIVVFLAGVAVYCYNIGKAYDLFVDNASFTHDGVTYDAFEAIQVRVDDMETPLFLLEGDRGAATVNGRSHVVIVEELDENDNVSKTHRIPFKSSELKGRVINVVPLVHGKLPGWSYPME